MIIIMMSIMIIGLAHLSHDADPSQPKTASLPLSLTEATFCSSSGYFPTWKAAACHYARSQLCQQTGLAIKLVTVQSRPSDRDAGGSGAAGQWEPQRPSFWHGVAYIIAYPTRLSDISHHSLIFTTFVIWECDIHYNIATCDQRYHGKMLYIAAKPDISHHPTTGQNCI